MGGSWPRERRLSRPRRAGPPLPRRSNARFATIAIAGVRVATGDYLVHLTTHFAYHLGQLDYHRRVVTGNASGAGTMRPAELESARPTGAEA